VSNVQSRVGIGKSTNELAAELRLQPQSLRKRYSQQGSYFGVRPEKLSNGRLRWPADALQALICPPSQLKG
jgi:hypothetical protein